MTAYPEFQPLPAEPPYPIEAGLAMGGVAVVTQEVLAVSQAILNAEPDAVSFTYAPNPADQVAYDRMTILQRLHLQARSVSGMAEWAERDPKRVLDEMVADLPSQPPRYRTLDEVPYAEDITTPMGLYFLSQLDRLPIMERDDSSPQMFSVLESVRCLQDKVRTKVFMQGVADAVERLDALKGDDETVQVLDAGTGAIPVMAIYAALCSDKVRCTAIEINPRSAEMARRIVLGFGLEDRITVVEGDAMQYVPDKIDLLVSETMHAGLSKEPLVDILNHFEPYVTDHGVILPSGVEVKAGLVAVSQYVDPPYYVAIGTEASEAVTPAWKRVATYKPGKKLNTIHFNLETKGLAPGTYVVALACDARIGRRRLTVNQSILTAPEYIRTPDNRSFMFDVKAGDAPARVKGSYAPGGQLSHGAYIVR